MIKYVLSFYKSFCHAQYFTKRNKHMRAKNAETRRKICETGKSFEILINKTEFAPIVMKEKIATKISNILSSQKRTLESNISF